MTTNSNTPTVEILQSCSGTGLMAGVGCYMAAVSDGSYVVSFSAACEKDGVKPLDSFAYTFPADSAEERAYFGSKFKTSLQRATLEFERRKALIASSPATLVAKLDETIRRKAEGNSVRLTLAAYKADQDARKARR